MAEMNKRIPIPPESIAKRRSEENFVLRALRHYTSPIYDRIKNQMIKRKWSHHADPRAFDWDWGATHYNRIAVVNLLLNRFDDPSYLEIGCASNALFNSVLASRKVGVDPVSGGTIRRTSDAFFAENRQRFDVVFIDGLHEYEQVRRDVIHAIRSMNDGGWIALHDMLPRNWMEHHVPVVSNSAWTGDVWKVAFELTRTQGVEFKIIKIDHGVGVIKVLDRSAELVDCREHLMTKEFNYYYDHIGALPIVEWEDALGWLRG